MATAYLLVDLTYGDASKGATVDWLARGGSAQPVHTVVRFNGGPQAGHNVVTPDGRRHTFSSFGSASLVPGVRTYLSRHVLVNPLNALTEANHLADIGVPDVLDRLVVDPDCLVITPYHVAANRLRELAREAAGHGRHGSCGMGIGETVADALADPDGVLRVRDLGAPTLLTAKFDAVRARKWAEINALVPILDGWIDSEGQVAQELRVFHDECLANRFLAAIRPYVARISVADSGWLADRMHHGATVFEPAQGTLLDEDHGFHPHTTWSHTTLRNATELLGETGFRGRVERIGLVRAYATRHGAGPFVVEDTGMTDTLNDPNNQPGAWQGAMRCGPFDAVATRYALAVNAAYGAVDELAVSHLDCIGAEWTYCDRYEHDGPTEQILASYDEGGVADLLSAKHVDLVRQERLTKLLNRCRPVVELVRPADVHDTIERLVGVPVRMVAHGPAATDRRWRVLRPSRFPLGEGERYGRAVAAA